MKKLILIFVIFLAACGTTEPVPAATREPLPTYTALPPLPTYTPLPTSVPPTFTPLPTNEPTSIPVTPGRRHPYLLVKVINDTVLREVCQNKKGELMFNDAGYPLLFECIFSTNGLPSGRVKYLAGESLLVYIDGDTRFFNIYGVYTIDGNAVIRTDGGHRYYMVAGPRGDGLFIDIRDVEVLGPTS